MIRLIYLITTWICIIAANGYRLPGDVIPEHYKLEIFTHLEEPDNFKFDGNVKIVTNCVRPTKNITLHSKGLAVDEKSLVVKDISGTEARPAKVDKIEVVKKTDFLVIHLEEPLVEDHKYEIFIAFNGELLEGLAGYYRSNYIDKATQKKKWLALTQFEPTSARKAFPCFDEPSMKATFEISLARMEGYNTISNMPIATTEPVENMTGWFWDRYENSVPMSTYLVAYIVSDFVSEISEPSQTNNITFKVWARKDAIDQVALPKEVGPKCLEYYEDFFGIKYPLPKQDMVAIPDFNAGAMENWGLITFREAYMLFDPKISTAANQHTVASVVAHELAHQWFGNLVTMKWWTDLWLNEGFATYMASIAIHHLFPEWNSLEEEAANNLVRVFTFDALKSSHPVSVPIEHHSEIDEIFDTISYKKGAFLIRMMSLFLGEEVLKRGVSNYLNKHKYGNAEQDDLWESLTEVAHQKRSLPANLTVNQIMDTWTLQTGYPVITVKRNYGSKTAEITQERFLRSDIELKDRASCWWVPLSYTTNEELDFNSTHPKSWLSCPLAVKTLDGMPDEKTWVIFNIQAAGLYKINYDEENWRLIIETLNSPDYKKIATLNRVQLIDDAADLPQTGILNYDVFFQLIGYLKYEDEYLPWNAALSNINAVKRHLERTQLYGKFKIYMQQLLTPIYEKLGGLLTIKSNKLDAIKHQVLIANWACRFEVSNCVLDAQTLLKAWQNNSNQENPIPKDIRSVVYCTSIRHGGENEWNFMWEQYNKSNVASAKNTILSKLGCASEVWLLRRLLDWSLDSKSGIRRQDSASAFSAVSGSPIGFYVAKEYLFSHIGKIYEYLKENPRKISSYLSSVSAHMLSESDLEEMTKFVQDNEKYLGHIKQGTEQSLETVRLNVEWQKKHFDKLGAILEKIVNDKK